MDEPIPDKGRVLTAMSAFWFEQLRRRRRPATSSPPTWPTCPSGAQDPRPGRSGRCCAARPRCCRSSASCAATSPARRGRSTRPTGTMHGAPLPDGPAGVRRSCPSRCSPRRPRPRSATTTRTSPSTQAVDLIGDGAGRAGPRRLARALPPGRRVGRRAGHHHRRHQVRARPGRRRAGAGRRGAHPGLVALLAGRPVGAGHHARRRSTSSRSATTSRRPRLGQDPAAARRCPTTSSPPPAPATSRPTSASPAGRFADWPGVDADGSPSRTAARLRRRPERVRDGAMVFSVQVEVPLRPGIADPAGRHHRAVAARTSASTASRGVRVGKSHPLRRRGRRRGRRPGRGRRPLPAVPHQPGDRGRRPSTLTAGGDRLMSRRGRRRPVPRSNCELDVVEAVAAARRRRRDPLARRRRPSPASTPSSSPAGSPTATTSAPAPSPASRR